MIAEPAPLLAVHGLEELPSDEVPMASFAGWALVNLIACALSVLLAAAALLRRRGEDAEGSRQSYKLFGAVAAVCSIVLFVLTENMRLAMHLVDRWTVLMLVILVINAVFYFAEEPAREEAAA